jgi:hypothetical protein
LLDICPKELYDDTKDIFNLFSILKIFLFSVFILPHSIKMLNTKFNHFYPQVPIQVPREQCQQVPQENCIQVPQQIPRKVCYGGGGGGGGGGHH